MELAAKYGEIAIPVMTYQTGTITGIGALLSTGMWSYSSISLSQTYLQAKYGDTNLISELLDRDSYGVFLGRPWFVPRHMLMQNNKAPVSKPSLNRLHRLIEKGQKPKGIDRLDKGGPNDPPHIHFKRGGALKRDGTWKHKGPKPTQKEIDWLIENGFLT